MIIIRTHRLGITMECYLAEIFQENYKFYFALVFRMVGNIADVEDILQTAFMRAYQSDLSKINNSDLKKWFVTVCRNTAITYMNKEKKNIARDHTYFLENEISQNAEDDIYFVTIAEELLCALPGELVPYFRKYLIEEIPIDVICRKHGVSKNKMRYWKKQLEKTLKKFL